MHGYVHQGVYTKYVDEHRHQLVKGPDYYHGNHTPMWCIDVEDYNLIVSRVDTIRFIDRDSGKRWTISMEDFAALKHPEPIDRGFGPQWAVYVTHWDLEED